MLRIFPGAVLKDHYWGIQRTLCGAGDWILVNCFTLCTLSLALYICIYDFHVFSDLKKCSSIRNVATQLLKLFCSFSKDIITRENPYIIFSLSRTRLDRNNIMNYCYTFYKCLFFITQRYIFFYFTPDDLWDSLDWRRSNPIQPCVRQSPYLL